MQGVRNKKEIKEKVEYVLEKVGMIRYKRRPAAMLSGGEKQRIGIARAFLHDAPMILLDEPTSNLDSLNEGIILKSLMESKENKTIIIVSHRKSTMNIADVVLDVEKNSLQGKTRAS